MQNLQKDVVLHFKAFRSGLKYSFTNFKDNENGKTNSTIGTAFTAFSFKGTEDKTSRY